MNTDQADQILDLSPQANRRAFDLIQQKMLKGLNSTRMNVRYDYIEWCFSDGSMVELEVLRDFNNDMKPYQVVVAEYAETTERAGPCHYKLVSHDQFEIK